MTAEEKLAADVRAHLSSMVAVREVKMFGGVGFMLNGNLVAAVSKAGCCCASARTARTMCWRGPERVRWR